jgi:uncharacterized protein involved in exopolysaccharide biosynthesis
VDAEDGEHAEEGIDLAKLKMLLGFFLRAPKRRPALAIVAPIVPLVVALGLAAWMPRTYTADIKVLAHRNAVLPEHDGVAAMQEPTAGVAEEVLKRDSLEQLVKSLDLVPRWEATRPPILHFKDSLFSVFHTGNQDETLTRALVGSLEKSLSVNTEGNTITFSADWPHAQTAYDLVTTAFNNFLEARRNGEVTVYTERLKMLEMRSQLAAQGVDSAIAELTKREEERRNGVRNEASAAATAGAANPPVAVPIPPATPEGQGRAVEPPSGPRTDVPASDETAHQLEDVRTQIRAAEDDRRRRIADAEAQLADAQGSLGPLHPTVLALKRKVEAVREPQPQLEALRVREKDLVAKLAADLPPQVPQGAPPPPMFRPAPSPTPGGVSPELRELLNRDRDDAPTAYARSKLQAASQEYNDILARMQYSKIELDVARESFKETYTVLRPAEVPNKPRKPNVPLILVFGILIAVLAAFGAPGVRDLLTGRYLEPWQVETSLKIPVLGALPAPEHTHLSAPPEGP